MSTFYKFMVHFGSLTVSLPFFILTFNMHPYAHIARTYGVCYARLITLYERFGVQLKHAFFSSTKTRHTFIFFFFQVLYFHFWALFSVALDHETFSHHSKAKHLFCEEDIHYK